MNAEQAAQLRAPFPDEAISLLPKVNCKACSDNKQTKHCDRHQMAKCQACNAWITSAHIHLSYVGHAETTDRFLAVDPEWTWDPLALDAAGLPAYDSLGGLWIRLTIAGVSRLGYGDAQGKQGPNAIKEVIGDALRNAGMRFGVALNLWAKSDLAALHADKETGAIADPAPAAPPAAASEPAIDPVTPDNLDVRVLRARIARAGKRLEMDRDDLEQDFAARFQGDTILTATAEQLQAYAKEVEKRQPVAA